MLYFLKQVKLKRSHFGLSCIIWFSNPSHLPAHLKIRMCILHCKSWNKMLDIVNLWTSNNSEFLSFIVTGLYRLTLPCKSLQIITFLWVPNLCEIYIVQTLFAGSVWCSLNQLDVFFQEHFLFQRSFVLYLLQGLWKHITSQKPWGSLEVK